MILTLIEKTVLFPFKLLDAFLTVMFFRNLNSASKWGRTPTVREQAQQNTIKRLSHQLLAVRYAQQREAVYQLRQRQEQDIRHRKEMQELEKRYRDRGK